MFSVTTSLGCTAVNNVDIFMTHALTMVFVMKSFDVHIFLSNFIFGYDL